MDSQRDQTNPSMFLMLSRLPVLQPDFEGKQVEEYVQFKIWETQRSSGGTAWYGVGASVDARVVIGWSGPLFSELQLEVCAR